MQSKNLKLFPISPELGQNYNQYQKEFRVAVSLVVYIGLELVTEFHCDLIGVFIS
jgi:hypothetical protein